MKFVVALAISIACLSAAAQEIAKPAPNALAEFNAAIAVVMKTPVTITFKAKKTESFCKRPETLNESEIKKLQLSCDKIITDPALPDMQKAAARYILGKTKTQYNAPDLANRYCDEAVPLLSQVADFYDQKNIIGNGPHEALASCLIASEKHVLALSWLERGHRKKDTAQSQYLAGLALQHLQHIALAKAAFERALALDATHEAARQSLMTLDELSEGVKEDHTATQREPTKADTPECQAWKSAIISNRALCDGSLNNSHDEFFSCMDAGMTRSGYGPRSDEQTQTLYVECGVSSWTDKTLKP